jgi:hypothetical protein
VNAPLLLLRSVLGLPVRARLGEYREVVMMRYWEEVFADASGERLPSLALSKSGGCP